MNLKHCWSITLYVPRHDKNQHNGFATSMDPDQPAHPPSLIRIHAVRLQTPITSKETDSKQHAMDPDQTARMRRLVWIHTSCKPIMLVLV
jgi:hypothetical protein